MYLMLFVIFFLSGCSQLQRTLYAPTEIEAYCQNIFRNTDESDAYNTCIRQESDAKGLFSRMIITPDIERRCRQLSAKTGGSYQVMLTCAQKEMRVKKGVTP